ncbi:MAG: Gfo/Idh/MocA family oxidoreductase, partial [Bacteroidia bacterium]|nr:Gfo/Idh/MocA family oxidoreductase [Bacteroidia bacterium]
MSKKKIGIIGCGHISDTHIKSWNKTKNSEVVGLFDIDENLLLAKAKKYGIKNTYTSLDNLIEACDVLDVCTPPQTHFTICMQVINAGKDLLIEKPLVTDVNEWEKLKEAINQKEVKVGLCHNLKFNLSVQNAKKKIEQGDIGQLLRINRYFLTHPDADRMLRGNSHWSHKLPGGRWYETMPHELYITHFFAGWSELDNVTALSTSNATEGAPADEVCFTLSNNNVISNYHYSSNSKQNKRYIEFIGTKGILTLDVLSDMMLVDKVVDSKKKRALGIFGIDALKKVAQIIPDRIRYYNQKLKGISPH